MHASTHESMKAREVWCERGKAGQRDVCASHANTDTNTNTNTDDARGTDDDAPPLSKGRNGHERQREAKEKWRKEKERGRNWGTEGREYTITHLRR